jgi:mRNA deadenylase 3'-5' endonuclease subunit Ccr4
MISKYFNSPDDLYIHEKNKKRNMIINSKVKNNDISICTYNILVPYLKYSNEYDTEIKPEIMWFYRWELIKREIDLYSPDIICFQEVETDLFYKDLLPYFLQKYMGYFIPKEPKPDSTYNLKYKYFNNNFIMGVAIFFKIKKFRLIHIESFDFYNYALDYYKKTDISLLDNKDFLEKINVGIANLIILFEDLRTEKRFFVGNLHIVNKPTLSDVKLLMIYLILDKLEKLSKNHSIPVILCGDFNSTPSSSVYNGITNGKNFNKHDDNVQLIQPIINLPEIFTNYPLSSTYFNIFKKEPLYTNYSYWKGTIDYIFINKHCKVIGQLEEPDLSGKERIPYQDYPSDHVLQMTIIRL